jgi:hypothetical protein
MRLVLSGITIKRQCHESVMSCVMGSGSSSELERSKNAAIGLVAAALIPGVTAF